MNISFTIQRLGEESQTRAALEVSGQPPRGGFKGAVGSVVEGDRCVSCVAVHQIDDYLEEFEVLLGRADATSDHDTVQVRPNASVTTASTSSLAWSFLAAALINAALFIYAPPRLNSTRIEEAKEMAGA